MENNNWKNWRVKVDVFRGYMKAKIEGLETTIQNHCNSAEGRRKEINESLRIMQTSIVEIKEFMAGKQATSKIKVGIYGFFGGLLPVILAFILYKLFG